MVYGSLWQWVATTYQHEIFHGAHFEKMLQNAVKTPILNVGPSKNAALT